MGGGDLNLKKSWHPSTTKNVEKVWKAEQKHEEEEKRITELRRQVLEQKEKEDLQKHAEDKGVFEKKNEVKLEWMYKKPSELVDREEYLLGRSIDKTFEKIQEDEKAASSFPEINNTKQGAPSSVRGLVTHQVDFARKLQEDPLFLIRQKELETRSQILKNPVKLKKLQQLISSRRASKSKKVKKEKKKKKRKKSSETDESDSESDIDTALLDKYNKLKDKLKETDIAALKILCADRGKTQKSSSKEKDAKKRKYDNMTIKTEDCRPQPGSSQDRGKYRSKNSEMSDSRKQEKPVHLNKFTPDRNWKKPERKKLTEEEIERRRAEMLDNAKWRENERDRNIAKQKAEEEKEKRQMKDFDKDFLRKQLSIAASQETVEGRIRSNINNIQRSGMAMDKNFARR